MSIQNSPLCHVTSQHESFHMMTGSSVFSSSSFLLCLSFVCVCQCKSDAIYSRCILQTTKGQCQNNILDAVAAPFELRYGTFFLGAVLHQRSPTPSTFLIGTFPIICFKT